MVPSSFVRVPGLHGPQPTTEKAEAKSEETSWHYCVPVEDQNQGEACYLQGRHELDDYAVGDTGCWRGRINGVYADENELVFAFEEGDD